MDVIALRNWLAEPRTNLIAAVAEDVRAHVETLRSRGTEFYGYALLPGEPYDIHSLVAVTNTEEDIKVTSSDSQYRYYRYCVNEWANWEHECFRTSNSLLVEANERFRSIHSKDDKDCWLDEFELAHADALLDSVLRGLEIAKTNRAFRSVEPFLVVWISDSDHRIMAESVRRLNSVAIAEEFLREFG